MREEQPAMKWYSVLWRGAAMGAADIIPGISGGTIAFITHIYDRLIHAVKQLLNLPRQVYAWIRKEKTLRSILQEADLVFLTLLITGILAAITVMSRVIPFLLDTLPRTTFTLFIGLIIGASIAIYQQTNKNLTSAAWIALGTALGYAVTLLPFINAPPTQALLFGLGTITISAMLLPGISGSYLLLVAGQYHTLLLAVQQPIQHIRLLSAFILGALVGAALFSHAIGYALKRFREATLTVLTGLMLGALAVPIQEVLDAPSGEPIILVLISGLFGLVLVMYLEARRQASSPPSSA